MAKDLFGTMMGRALQRQAPQGHMTAFITQGEADVLRSLGGGVSPNGGQIMRNGIPSFQRYKGTDDAVLDYVIPSQYQEAAVSDPMNLFNFRNEIEPQKVNTFIENEREIAQMAQEEQQAELDAGNELQRTYVPRGNSTLERRGGPLEVTVTDPTITGLPEAEELSDSYMPVIQPGEQAVARDLGIVPLANILRNIDRDPNTGDMPGESEGLWDSLKTFGKSGGILGQLWRTGRDRFSEEGRRKYDLQKDIYRKQRQLYKDAGLDENEIQRIHDQSVRLGLDPLRNAPRNVVGMNRLFGESDRDIAQRAQEEQQADLDMQLANELANAIIDAPVGGDDPDTELTPEEIAHQERVRKNIEGLSPEYRRRLGLEKAEIESPWMPGPGFGPIGGPEGGIPGGIPEGFTAPMTHINPGDYPDTFINDSTGQLFTAPSLGYVPPAGWRRLPSGERERIDWKGIPGTFPRRIGFA